MAEIVQTKKKKKSDRLSAQWSVYVPSVPQIKIKFLEGFISFELFQRIKSTYCILSYPWSCLLSTNPGRM